MNLRGRSAARFRQMEASAKRKVAAGIVAGAGITYAVVSHPAVVAFVIPPKRYH